MSCENPVNRRKEIKGKGDWVKPIAFFVLGREKNFNFHNLSLKNTI
jgi:hypothetical protein